jgi:hypothetical protein
MSVAEVGEHMQALIDLGFLETRPQEVPRPEGPCRRCGKPADGLDQLCDPCRAPNISDYLKFAYHHGTRELFKPLSTYTADDPRDPGSAQNVVATTADLLKAVQVGVTLLCNAVLTADDRNSTEDEEFFRLAFEQHGQLINEALRECGRYERPPETGKARADGKWAAS